MQKSQVTNTNGQEVNFICLVRRAVFSASRRNRVLGGIAWEQSVPHRFVEQSRPAQFVAQRVGEPGNRRDADAGRRAVEFEGDRGPFDAHAASRSTRI